MSTENLPNQLFLDLNMSQASFEASGVEKNGNESFTWTFVDKLGVKQIIKRYPHWIRESDIEWIHKYMYQLSDNDYPLAKPTRTPISDGKHFYGVYEKSDGCMFEPDNKDHYSDIANKLSLLHNIGRQISVPGVRNWPTTAGYDADKLLLVNIDNGLHQTLLLDSWKLAQILLQSSELQIIPIHGDFRPDNIRFNKTGIEKVFDFGNSRNDYPEVDIAITLRSLSSHLPLELQIQNHQDFLTAYNLSNNNTTSPSIEGICHAELVLAIQECTYLWNMWIATNDVNLKHKFLAEYDYLKYLRQLVGVQLRQLKNID